MKNPRLPAEWEAQDAVLLAWPHEQTDWHRRLPEVQQTFLAIIRAICHSEIILLAVHDRAKVGRQLREARINLKRVRLYQLPYNDTWARDFGPLTIQNGQTLQLLDFTFNGWGNKFGAEQDNLVSRRLSALGAFGATALRSFDLILEGGSLESDGAGSLLTTSACLLEENRNPLLSKDQLETELKIRFGADQVLWLEQGALQGDDTDSHIDTLARFAPANTILYQACEDPNDEHYAVLAAMRDQLGDFCNSAGERYKLLPLPWPSACYDEEGGRLPATYANFLIINGAVLVPSYNDPADAEAARVIQRAFPERQVISINCRPLIEQHGSLHCVTMQIPRGVLS
jgi:agmatine deiminase